MKYPLVTTMTYGLLPIKGFKSRQLSLKTGILKLKKSLDIVKLIQRGWAQ